MEMWAQDAAAMLGYHAGATSAASTLTPFGALPASLTGFAGVSAVVSSVATQAQVVMAAAPAAMSALQSLPLQNLSALMYPASMAMYPMSMIMGLARMGGTPGLAGAAAAATPKLASRAVPAIKPLGGGGLHAAMSAGLGKARLVGAMSVPPAWQGSTPARMASSAMRGLAGAGMPTPAATAGAAAAAAGRPMPLPMPMGGMGAGAGVPGGMMGRGGASPHVSQSRPSVVPRTGV
ncbi:hypothetical protein A5673_21920 [Mycobacterium sp. E3198]|nr:hypothetical protein A5673_21920 [Mycobacterium sp. E3198]